MSRRSTSSRVYYGPTESRGSQTPVASTSKCGLRVAAPHALPIPTAASESVYYLYALAGNVVTELNSSGDWNRVEIHAAGKYVATYSGGASGTTYFDHVDWLGTERARTDAQGDMTETCTSLAFGDDLSCTGTASTPCPGQIGRGEARLVTGAGGEIYYTPDHYDTFVRIR